MNTELHGYAPSSRSDGVGAWTAGRLQLRLDPVDPVTEHGTSVARINQIVHAKGLGASVRRALAGDLLFEFTPPHLRVGCCSDLAAIGDRDTTFEWQGATFSRRPGEDHTTRSKMSSAGYAVYLTHDYRYPRYGRLHDGEERGGAVANRGRLLGFRANHKAWLVYQANNGQVEGIAEVHQTSHLLCAFSCHRAGIPGRIVGQDAYRLAVEARHAGDL